ncbi:carboxypeptidase M isoform X3 [Microcaecilia unicolor]|uniref:Carboxypeptidase M isoform X3 n=1 Tax=Microcaecilia unicolor TaxID=1415580 RepID=A0A6P7YVZ5_9AMPH|nr:carboxypeptidase M isoform X3 [Microcaecilia unicolor]
MDLLCFFLVVLLPSVLGLDFGYHSTESLENFLKTVNQNYPSITHLHSIGKSVAETCGFLSLEGFQPNIQLGYRSLNMLPICTEMRYNKNKFDLNRNFPDAFEANTVEIQPETQAVMDWVESETFVLSANLHGGAMVASFPYDNSNAAVAAKGVTPDQDVFIHLAKTYSFTANMSRSDGCDDSNRFEDGITNGYTWYPVQGGMQDYNYIWGQCFEITLELSCCKYPPENELQTFWATNRPALIEYMKQVHLGVKGQVFDIQRNPIANAIVEVVGRNHICPYRTNQNGEYYLLLLPGNYTLNVTVPGFKSITQKLELPAGHQLYSALKYDIVYPGPAFRATTSTTQIPSCPKAVSVSSTNEAALLLSTTFTLCFSATPLLMMIFSTDTLSCILSSFW